MFSAKLLIAYRVSVQSLAGPVDQTSYGASDLTHACYKELTKWLGTVEVDGRPCGSLILSDGVNELDGVPMPERWAYFIQEAWPSGPPANLPVFDHTPKLRMAIASQFVALAANYRRLVQFYQDLASGGAQLQLPI